MLSNYISKGHRLMIACSLCISMLSRNLTQKLSVHLHTKSVLLGNMQCKHRSTKTGDTDKIQCSADSDAPKHLTRWHRITYWPRSPQHLPCTSLDYRHTQLAMFPMRAHEGGLMHSNGIEAEIQFNKYIYHMVGINVPTNFSLEE